MRGHYQTHCPVANSSGNPFGGRASSSPQAEDASLTPDQEVSTTTIRGALLSQHHLSYLNLFWVLLDSESTDHIFCNRDLLTDIRPTTDGEVLQLHTSEGVLETSQRGKFGEMSVWYNSTCIANVLSLALVTEHFRVTMDSSASNAFHIHINKFATLVFSLVEPGLYLLDASQIGIHKLRTAFSFLSTVSDNKKMFTASDVTKAKRAITLNRRLNHVAPAKFEHIISNNWIRNCPVTIHDVRRSHSIYGPPLPPIKGRSKYRAAPRVTTHDEIPLPRQVYEDLKHVTLCADFYFVNGITVFHTISRKINYCTVSFPASRSAAVVKQELQKVLRMYNSHGFKVIEIHADNEFSKVEDDIRPIRIHACGTDEHVPEIERSVQTCKNENRSVCHSLPYCCMPRLMIGQLIMQSNTFLNTFGPKDPYGDGLTPRNIIENLPHIDYNDLKYEFGQYVQLHIQESPTNTMKSRTIGAVVLGPCQALGRYDFMSLETGAQIDGRVVATLPITNEVIQ